MGKPAFFTPEVEDFRMEAAVEDVDGTLVLTLHGSNDNKNALKRPFDALHVNGIDDGDPHFLYPSA